LEQNGTQATTHFKAIQCFSKKKIDYLKTGVDFYSLIGVWRGSLKVLFEQMDALPNRQLLILVSRGISCQ